VKKRPVILFATLLASQLICIYQSMCINQAVASAVGAGIAEMQPHLL